MNIIYIDNNEIYLRRRRRIPSKFIVFFALILHAFDKAKIAALTTSSFHGQLSVASSLSKNLCPNNDSKWFMRKQKASDRRTRRLQQQGNTILEKPPATFTRSPLQGAVWSQKTISESTMQQQRKHWNGKKELGGGRNRSKKRSYYYNTVSSYHNHFLKLLTAEYKSEEEVVLRRLRRSVDNPLLLESAGHALLDMQVQRRGNLFSDEVYRFTKAPDASSTATESSSPPNQQKLPSVCQFAKNDVIMVTHQPNGSGDFFGLERLPIDKEITTIEGRVLNRGPTYVDVSFVGGMMTALFGISVEGDQNASKLRVRLDRFFSNIPYTRMVSSLSQLTYIAPRDVSTKKDVEETKTLFSKIVMDPLLKDTILHSFVPPSSEYTVFGNCSNPGDDARVNDFAKRCAKTPLPNSASLADEVLQYIQSNPHRLFPVLNQPQLNAIAAALTRRLTLIQGPPGTGKTTVGASIAFGFVHQCLSIAPENTKVLACAFSNVGADNLAEKLIQLGLKVVRIGKASTAVSESLWDCTLDAAIHKDQVAREALRKAAVATAQLKKTPSSGQSPLSESSKRAAATAAVKASIQACNVAATKAFREADVIVTTCIGAADPRLLAACGIGDNLDADDMTSSKRQQSNELQRQFAPDGKAPLSLPFVLIDEACQSVEPATLVPLVSSNSCRSLVLLGDPCQLPPTVLATDDKNSNPLTISLMERLSTCLPPPPVASFTQNNMPKSAFKDVAHLHAKPTQQALSLFRLRQDQFALWQGTTSAIYRKRFAGALLLSVQYRMHPSIAAFSSAVFYDSLLSTPSFLKKYRALPFPSNFLESTKNTKSSKFDNPLDWHVRFVNVGGRCNERKGNSVVASTEDNTSYSNELEAKQVVQIVEQLVEDERYQIDNHLTIGIITPYKAQVKLIQQKLEVASAKKEIIDKIVEIKSVDGYQGRERDVIIFSTVRSNRHGKIGFLTDWRRLNVAWTRAKHGLIMVGDHETLEESHDPYWSAVIKYFQATKSMLASSDLRNITSSR